MQYVILVENSAVDVQDVKNVLLSTYKCIVNVQHLAVDVQCADV